MGRKTILRAEGMSFRGASWEVVVEWYGLRREGWERERRVDVLGGARLDAGICASVAVAELAVGLDSRVLERESKLPG